jgi:predicted RNA-binding Zn-ribbon protein involved in translation (DUF1610 family)
MIKKLFSYIRTTCHFCQNGETMFGAVYECSSCGYEPEERPFVWNFCPNCGRRIISFNEENSEEC